METLAAARRLAARNPLRDMGLRSAGLTRRRLVQSIAASAAVSAAGLAAQAADRDLALLTWDAYADPRLLALWHAKTGGGIRYEIHISDPTSVDRLRSGETVVWDVVNLNNPWARRALWPAGLIRDLPRDRFEPFYEAMAARFAPPYRWATSEDGKRLLGVVQRYETFDFVVNAEAIDPATARDEGWDLFGDGGLRFGILAYEDWNVVHICMGAGVHPFREKTEADFAAFEVTARDWVRRAAQVTTDFGALNVAILRGEIDAYVSGGTYTTAAARLEGMAALRAVTPARGPADGKGGTFWVEVNSAVANPDEHPRTLDFLEWITSPEAALIVAGGNGNWQPVSQMGQPAVLERFPPAVLEAMQYDGLDERIADAVELDIVPDYDRLHAIYAAALRARS